MQRRCIRTVHEHEHDRLQTHWRACECLVEQTWSTEGECMPSTQRRHERSLVNGCARKSCVCERAAHTLSPGQACAACAAKGAMMKTSDASFVSSGPAATPIGCSLHVVTCLAHASTREPQAAGP
eukprot:2422063-Lingulodinium_polyedra.AAC.2